MGTNRRANAVTFGFDFQTSAAIILMLENIKELNSLRVEGELEDIQIELDNKEYILSQAKSVVLGSSDFKNVKANLKKSLISLTEGALKAKEKGFNIKKLILITNSFNPLNDKNSKPIFSGPPSFREYNSLPESSRKIIDKYIIENNLDIEKEKFWIETLPFETDYEDERYKYVYSTISEFVGNLGLNIPNITKRIFTLWRDDVFKNSTKKDSEILLTKKQIIWPMIVIITDIELQDNKYMEEIDEGIYEEVVHLYKSLITSSCEKYETITKILFDFNEYKKIYPSHKINDFIEDRWKEYINAFYEPDIDKEVQKALIQIILFNILKKRYKIDNIKKKVNL